MKKNIYKKIGLTTILALSILIGSEKAFAVTSATLSPTSISSTPGSTFSVSIALNPQGTANFADKVEITYPAETLEVTSFTWGSTWMPLTQTGYDSIDNTNGIVIKTGGYPGGFSTAQNFGTLTFRVKKVGTGTIRIGNNSLAYESNRQTAITGNTSSFAVTSPTTPVPTPRPVTPTTVAPVPDIATSTDTFATTTSTTTDFLFGTSTIDSDTAAVGNFFETTNGKILLWVLAFLVLLGLVIFGFTRKGVEKSKK